MIPTAISNMCQRVSKEGSYSCLIVLYAVLIWRTTSFLTDNICNISALRRDRASFCDSMSLAQKKQQTSSPFVELGDALPLSSRTRKLVSTVFPQPASPVNHSTAGLSSARQSRYSCVEIDQMQVPCKGSSIETSSRRPNAATYLLSDSVNA